MSNTCYELNEFEIDQASGGLLPLLGALLFAEVSITAGGIGLAAAVGGIGGVIVGAIYWAW